MTKLQQRNELLVKEQPTDGITLWTIAVDPSNKFVVSAESDFLTFYDIQDNFKLVRRVPSMSGSNWSLPVSFFNNPASFRKEQKKSSSSSPSPSSSSSPSSATSAASAGDNNNSSNSSSNAPILVFVAPFLSSYESLGEASKTSLEVQPDLENIHYLACSRDFDDRSDLTEVARTYRVRFLDTNTWKPLRKPLDAFPRNEEKKQQQEEEEEETQKGDLMMGDLCIDSLNKRQITAAVVSKTDKFLATSSLGGYLRLFVDSKHSSFSALEDRFLSQQQEEGGDSNKSKKNIVRQKLEEAVVAGKAKKTQENRNATLLKRKINRNHRFVHIKSWKLSVGDSDDVSNCLFSTRDEEMLVACDLNNQITVYDCSFDLSSSSADLSGPKIVFCYKCHSGWPWFCYFARNDQIFSCSDDKTICAVNVPSQKLTKRFELEESIYTMAIYFWQREEDKYQSSPIIAACNGEGVLFFDTNADINTAVCRIQIRDSSRKEIEGDTMIFALQFSVDGKYVFVGTDGAGTFSERKRDPGLFNLETGLPLSGKEQFEKCEKDLTERFSKTLSKQEDLVCDRKQIEAEKKSRYREESLKKINKSIKEAEAEMKYLGWALEKRCVDEFRDPTGSVPRNFKVFKNPVFELRARERMKVWRISCYGKGKVGTEAFTCYNVLAGAAFFLKWVPDHSSWNMVIAKTKIKKKVLQLSPSNSDDSEEEEEEEYEEDDEEIDQETRKKMYQEEGGDESSDNRYYDFRQKGEGVEEEEEEEEGEGDYDEESSMSNKKKKLSIVEKKDVPKTFGEFCTDSDSDEERDD